MMENVRFTLFFLAALLALSPAIQAQVYDGDITLTTQDEVDDFGAMYTVVEGTLTIQESAPGAILNLNALSGLIEVGELWISNNEALEVINLMNLSSIGSSGIGPYYSPLYILDNASLKSIIFPALETVSSEFGNSAIISNPALESISFSALTNFFSGLQVSNNSSLESVSFSKLTEVLDLYISLNDVLRAISFPELTTAEDINIESNDALETIRFPKLAEVIDPFFSFPGSIVIRFNWNLTTIYFPGLIEISWMDIRNNTVLADCCSIAYLVDGDLSNGEVSGSVQIESNASGCNSVSDILATCSDEDGDGIPNDEDNCFNPGGTNDTDNDSVADAYDQCPCADDRIDVDGNGCPDCSPTANGGINYDEASLSNFYCDKQEKKVFLTFYPPDNPDNPQVLCVAISAIPSLFEASPSSYLGDGNACMASNSTAAGRISSEGLSVRKTSPLHLFPNPVRHQLHFTLQAPAETTAQARVYNLHGQLLFIRSLSLVKGFNTDFLEVGDFQDGLYLLEVRFREERLQRRFVVQK